VEKYMEGDWDKNLKNLNEIKIKIKNNNLSKFDKQKNYNMVEQNGKLKIHNRINYAIEMINIRNEIKQNIENIEKEIQRLSNNKP